MMHPGTLFALMIFVMALPLATRGQTERAAGQAERQVLHAPASFDVNLDYTRYFGGSKNETCTLVRVDRAGNVIVCGMTISEDFPLLPAGEQFEDNVQTVFVTKFSPDGQILFSKRLPTATYIVHDMAIGMDDAIVLLVRTNRTSFDTILTPDAQHRDYSQYGFVILDSDGLLQYASYIRSEGLQEIVDMETDSNGDIYLLAHTYVTPPMVTPDALFPVNQGVEDGFIMRFSGSDYSLAWATCFGGSAHEEYMSLAVDGCSVAIVAVVPDGTFPLVNPVQSANAGGIDYVISRISGDGQQIIWSTWLGGSGSELFYSHSRFSRLLRFDNDGNLYFLANSFSQDFPLTDDFSQDPSSQGNTVLCKFSPEGDLLLSAAIGSSGSESWYELDVDDCGHAIISGRIGATDFPLVGEFSDEGSSFIIVVDTETPALLFSSLAGSALPLSIALDGKTVFMAGAVQADRGLPATPGRQEAHPIGNDIMLTSLTMPDLCPRPAMSDAASAQGEMLLDAQLVDTIRIDTSRMYIHPSRFPLSLTLANPSPDTPLDSLKLLLLLPSGLGALPGSPPLEFDPGPFQPLEQKTWEWEIQADLNSLLGLTELRVRAQVGTPGPCPLLELVRRHIVIEYTDLGYMDVACSLELRESIRRTPDGRSLDSEFAFLDLRIENLTDEEVPLGPIHLQLPPDAGVTPVDPTDAVMSIPPIPAQGQADIAWKVRILAWQFDRSVKAIAVISDTFDYAVQYCETDIVIPGVAASACDVDAPATARVLPDGSTEPDPITVVVTIENPSDTTRFYSDLGIDLGSAPHLRLAANEHAGREDFYIRERFRRVFTWELETVEDIGDPVTEEVYVCYVTDSDGHEHCCSHSIDIQVLREEVLCGITAVDALSRHPESGALVDNTVTIGSIVMNHGALPLQSAEASLSIPVEHGATIFGEQRQALATLQPGESDTVQWDVQVPGYPHARDVPFTVTVHSVDGAELTQCAHLLYVPAIEPFCHAEAPDTIYFDPVTRRFTPETFTVTATLHNPSDTTLSDIIAEIDTSGLQRALLLSPPVSDRAVLSAGGQWQAHWLFEARWAAESEEVSFPVNFRITLPELGSSCARMLHIEGAPLDVNLRCSTAGHDSAWADPAYEQFIPNPLQLQYTLHNEGNTMMRGCEIAIITPPMLDLQAGQDSVRLLPDLLPGDSFSAEWLLDIAEDRVTQGPWIVRWESNCDGDSIDTQCEHAIQSNPHAPAGIVLTPWLLRFAAEQDGPLPPAQTVMLWSGGGQQPRWSVAAMPVWLQAVPLAGEGRQEMTAQPNTTSLAGGLYHDDIRLTPTPQSTGNIQVLYLIDGPLADRAVPLPSSDVFSTLYPQPVRRGDRLWVEIHAQPAQRVTWQIRDLLGRELHRGELILGATGFERLGLATGDLPAGSVLLLMQTEGRSMSKLFVITP